MEESAFRNRFEKIIMRDHIVQIQLIKDIKIYADDYSISKKIAFFTVRGIPSGNSFIENITELR